MSAMESGDGDAAKQIALGFSNLSVYVEKPVVKPLLYGVNGYVNKGCVTAVLGASASGKSLLLQTLSARIQELPIKGDVFMDGSKVDPWDLSNPIALVPQFGCLCGELTAREVTRDTANLKHNLPKESIDKEVQELLEKLGLSHVADGIIGTILFRGISGGQKKRVEMGAELVASPSILLCDEPTSGLDSSIAYEVIKTVRDLAHGSQGRLSIILTIHQPNSSLLGLFDHILLLERGSSIFFGTVDESLKYFNRIGCPCPNSVTPTDYFLQISDSNFSFAKDIDFQESFIASPESKFLVDTLAEHKKLCEGPAKAIARQDSMATKMTKNVHWSKKWFTLVYRDYTLAFRDPTLYYFQVFLMCGFSFMAGAVFYQLPYVINGNFNVIPGGLIWLVYFCTWVHAFKVYYIANANIRTTHEMGNNAYSAIVASVADSFSTATLTLTHIPIFPIGYFMMGYPAKAFPFFYLTIWMTGLAGEATAQLCCKFSKSAVFGMVLCQTYLVCLQVFGGGVMLAWKDCPKYWLWLQEITVFKQASCAINMWVYHYMDFKCSTLTGSYGECSDPGSGAIYQCDSYYGSGTGCMVNGREILWVTQGVGREDNCWYYFAYVVAIYFGVKLLVVLLTIYPFETLVFKITHYFNPIDGNNAIDLKSAYETTRKNVNNNDQKGEYKQVATVAPKQEEEAAVASPKSNPDAASFSFSNVDVVLPKTGQKLIDHVSGFVKAGRTLALMGPSGAGKTTLLNALAHRAKYADISGKVEFAGREVVSADLTYVPQFDEVNEIMTVYEHMIFVGRLTCTDEKHMLQRSEELLDVLGLTNKRHTQVRNLSGGERKRICIGVGLISKPNILFLDEPTTGLDSTAAFSIVSYLTKVAKATNVAVIMTIHQPSALVFEMLDDLMILAAGKTVYAGTIADAGSYFASVGAPNPQKVNPADYYLEQVPKTLDNGKTWPELFSESPRSKDYSTRLSEAVACKTKMEISGRPSAVYRFWVTFVYFMKYFVKEPGIFFYRLAALIFIAVFAGTLYLNLQETMYDISGFVGSMFFTVLAVMLTANASTSVFAKDRREAVDRVANGYYSPGVFVGAQFLASAFFNLFSAFVFTCIFHWLTNLNPSGECFVYDILITWGHVMLMESFLMVLIEVLKNEFLCTTGGMVFLGMNMLFSGFFRPIPQIPPSVRWLCYIVPCRWSFEGFLWQIFIDRDFAMTGAPGMFVSGEWILNNVFDLHNIPSWGFFGALVGYVMFFRGCHYILFAAQTDVIHVPLPHLELPKCCTDLMNSQAPKVEPSPVAKSVETQNTNEGLAPMEIVRGSDEANENI